MGPGTPRRGNQNIQPAEHRAHAVHRGGQLLQVPHVRAKPEGVAAGLLDLRASGEVKLSLGARPCNPTRAPASAKPMARRLPISASRASNQNALIWKLIGQVWFLRDANRCGSGSARRHGRQAGGLNGCGDCSILTDEGDAAQHPHVHSHCCAGPPAVSSTGERRDKLPHQVAQQITRCLAPRSFCSRGRVLSTCGFRPGRETSRRVTRAALFRLRSKEGVAGLEPQAKASLKSAPSRSMTVRVVRCRSPLWFRRP